MTFVEVEYRMQVVKTPNKVVNRASNDECEDPVSIGSSLRLSLYDQIKLVDLRGAHDRHARFF
jgi:hypothetical protein